MKFSKALEYIEKGHKVRRFTWSDTTSYITKMEVVEGKPEILKCFMGYKSPFTPNNEDLFAVDWVLFIDEPIPDYTFKEAYTFMKECKCRIKLPEWEGYWYWDNDTIMIHLKDGNEIDIRETKDVDYTFGFILRDDWMVL